MTALTSIGATKTPSRPTEITFAAETGTPSDSQEVLLIGKKDAVSGSATLYSVTTISNSGDKTAASGEVATKFGDGSELAKMVLAAIDANSGGSNFPQIKCIPLASTDSDFGASDAALTAAQRTKHEFIVSPFDGINETLSGKIETHAQLVSGAFRVENNQFGTIAVVANKSVSDTDNLPAYDSQFICPVWLRDTSGAHPRSLGEIAAMSAARMAARVVPFYNLDKVTIENLEAPTQNSDHITVGQNLESDAALAKGWTPLFVKPNGDVAFVRTVTSRLSVDGTGSPIVGAYFDVQDFQVLYYWRKTVYTRLSQPDLTNAKASVTVANRIKGELIRLAKLFETNEMFQAVDQLSKKFIVQRSTSDRHRFDVKTPVNVIPGLHVVASNVEATTEYDTLTV